MYSKDYPLSPAAIAALCTAGPLHIHSMDWFAPVTGLA
jgi:hypothetical protein